jgi:flagellar basal body-associated protein FliL
MKQKTIIFLLITIVVIIVVVVIFYLLSRPIKPEFTPAFSQSETTGSMLTNYDVRLKNFDKDKAVLFKNVVASTSDNDAKYFKVDILIVTNNKESAKVLKRYHQTTVLVIANTLLHFKKNEVSSIEGKKYLKERIKMELEKKYGSGIIKKIFFENFITS